MTTLLSVPSKQYKANTYNNAFNVPAGFNTITITLSRENWPTGTALSDIVITDPTGVQRLDINAIVGGVIFARDGTTVIANQVCSFGVSPDEVLPAGQYSVNVTVNQTLRTAINVSAT